MKDGTRLRDSESRAWLDMLERAMSDESCPPERDGRVGKHPWEELPRDVALERRTAAWIVALHRVLEAHRSALVQQDWNAIVRTFKDVNIVAVAIMEDAISFAGKAARRTKKARHDATTGRRVKRSNEHDWERICQDYDEWISTGLKRYNVTDRLSRRHKISKDVLNRGLRQRCRSRKHLP